MIKLINHIDTLTAAIPVKCRYDSKKHYLENKLCFKITGDIKSANKIMICLHGLGGSKDANYINSLTNSFMDEFKGCVIASDMPGVGDSVNTEKIWGIQKDVADVYIDDIIQFIVKTNLINDRKIFLVGFSGGAGSIINYLTDDGSIISNKNIGLITHTYLISPAGPYVDCLIWIRDNSVFNKYIAIFHTSQQIKFILKNKKFDLFSRLNKDTFFDIMLSNIWVNGNDEYKFNFGKDKKL
jgi:pimeloyl-ACP methyl ester carboxylesterase